MKQNFLLAFATNKHRYWFVGGVFVFLVFSLMTLAFVVQSGITLKEQQSAVTSATLALSREALYNVIDLPYHLLQKISLHFFGLTPLGIKLPSLIIGAVIGLLLALLLKRWLLRLNIALFTSLIAITNVQFLSTSATGTPLIMTILWGLLIFLVGLRLVTRQKSLFWLLLLTVVISLSLYTPLSIYIVLALGAIAILHPHLRHLIKKTPKWHFLIASAVAFILLLPLLYSLLHNTSQAWQLFGFPEKTITVGDLRHNIASVIKMYGTIWYGDLSILGVSPIFSLASLCLILLGAFRVISNLHAARSYGLISLFPLLLIPVLIQPLYITILFVPIILLLSIGIETLLDEWYKLFPENPYARVVALAPFAVLMIGIMLSNITFYTNIYRYNVNLSRYVSHDLALVTPLVNKYPSATLVTTSLDHSFYDLLRRQHPGISVTTSIPSRTTQTTITTPGVPVSLMTADTFDQLVTDHYKERSPRFYIFTQQ